MTMTVAKEYDNNEHGCDDNVNYQEYDDDNTMIMMTMSMSMARNGTFVPLEQETGSSAKYTASGFIPDHPGYIA